MAQRSVTRRNLLRTGTVASIISLGGCVGFGSDIGVVDSDGGGAPPARTESRPATRTRTESATETETEGQPETVTIGQYGFVEDFEDQDLSEWEGDTDAFTITSEATRGSYAASLDEGFTKVQRQIRPTTATHYSFWWNVTRNSDLTVFFQDKNGEIGFSCEIRPGQGEGVVLNTDREVMGDPVYNQVTENTWYRVAFTNVDFADQEYEAALYDSGDVELIRTDRSFLNPIDAVSRIVIRNNIPGNGGPVRLDHLEVG